MTLSRGQDWERGSRLQQAHLDNLLIRVHRLFLLAFRCQRIGKCQIKALLGLMKAVRTDFIPRVFGYTVEIAQDGFKKISLDVRPQNDVVLGELFLDKIANSN